MQYVGGHGLWAPVYFYWAGEGGPGCRLVVGFGVKNGQLALKVRASPRPDLAARQAPKTASRHGTKIEAIVDFAPGGDHAYKPPHVNEEDTPRTKAQNDPRAHALFQTQKKKGQNPSPSQERLR